MANHQQSKTTDALISANPIRFYFSSKYAKNKNVKHTTNLQHNGNIRLCVSIFHDIGSNTVLWWDAVLASVEIRQIVLHKFDFMLGSMDSASGFGHSGGSPLIVLDGTRVGFLDLA